MCRRGGERVRLVRLHMDSDSDAPVGTQPPRNNPFSDENSFEEPKPRKRKRVRFSSVLDKDEFEDGREDASINERTRPQLAPSCATSMRRSSTIRRTILLCRRATQ